MVVTLNASEALLTLAGLGFLGFASRPHAAAEWGYDLNRSVSDVTSGIWWDGDPAGRRDRAGGARITLVGESLNDLSDPRLRTRRLRGPGTRARHRHRPSTAPAEASATASPAGPPASAPSDGSPS